MSRDFEDVEREDGGDAVRAAISGARHVWPESAPEVGNDDAWHLPVIDATSWIDRDPPDRNFIVDSWLVRGTAALLVGEDGIGKSLIGQQLATCIAWGRPFLGLPVKKGPALYISCEDDELELWRRQRAINETLGVPRDCAPALLSSLVGYTGVELGGYGEDGHFRLSTVAHGIIAQARDAGCALIVLDNLAHMFAGNENARREVATFCSGLERMAIETGATVLMLAHPSKGGAEYSGSTGWSAHVRQRWFMERPQSDDGIIDRAARVLRKSKANYAESGAEVQFRWHRWAFVVDADLSADTRAELAQCAAVQEENAAFLKCLAAATAARRAVSHINGSNYAPRIFAKMIEAGGVRISAFERAMERLIHRRAILLDQELWKGPDRHMRKGIKLADDCGDPPAGTPCGDPRAPSTQVIENAAGTLRAGTPLYTTYNGAASQAAAPISGIAIMAPGETGDEPVPGFEDLA